MKMVKLRQVFRKRDVYFQVKYIIQRIMSSFLLILLVVKVSSIPTVITPDWSGNEVTVSTNSATMAMSTERWLINDTTADLDNWYFLFFYFCDLLRYGVCGQYFRSVFRCKLQRALIVDLTASTFGFLSNSKTELQIQIDGECLNSGSTQYCQPLIGFGNGEYGNYFIMTYLIDDTTQTIAYYPNITNNGVSLAPGQVNTLLPDYSGGGSPSVSRDTQFSRAVTTGDGFTGNQEIEITGNPWPITLVIANNEARYESSTQVNGGEITNWTSPFMSDTPLSLCFLNRLRYDNQDISGFEIWNITVELVDSTATTANPTSAPSEAPSFSPILPPTPAPSMSVATQSPTTGSITNLTSNTSEVPTASPSLAPSFSPIIYPTPAPSVPSDSPTESPTDTDYVVTQSNQMNHSTTSNSDQFGSIFLYLQFRKCCTCFHFRNLLKIGKNVSSFDFEHDVTSRNPNAVVSGTSSTETEFTLDIYLIYGIILGAVFLFLLISLIDAWYIRINDYFDYGCIIKALLGFLDFLSDLLFAVQLTMYCLNDDVKVIESVMTIASYCFIIFPMMFSFGQLLRQNDKEWIHVVHLRNWMRSYSHVIYIISVFSGSAFNAVSLVNCEALKLEVFSMGLSKRQRLQFNAGRLWSVVACEV